MTVSNNLDLLKLYGILSLLSEVVDDKIHEEYQSKLNEDQTRN